jgi:uncharacterized phage protein (TIGR02220 family)
VAKKEEPKGSFIIFIEWRAFFEHLPPEKAMELLSALFDYEESDGMEIPELEAGLFGTFCFMKKYLDQNRVHYKAKCDQLKKNRDKWVQEQTKKSSNQSDIGTNRKDITTDNVNDNVDDNVDVNDNVDDSITLLSGKPDGRVVEIVDYLNLVLGTHYKVNGKKTGSLIRSRLKEGYTVEDFKQVITKKHAEWAGTEREKYLRPETLFCADHFEGYLNQMYVAEKSPVQSVADEWMAWAEREEAKERGDYVDTEGVCEPDGDGDSFLPDFGD